MNTQELNKKLAEWAGVESMPMEKIHYDHSTTIVDTLPNFTNSLDACFKWLRPKAREKKMLFNYTKMWDKLDRAESPSPASAYALVFCLEIEKLINGGKR